MKAYVDESFGRLGDNRAYVVAAACVSDRHLARVRQALDDLNPHAGKLHWHKERTKTRLELLSRMSPLPVTYHVVIRNSQDERPERQRRMCLQELMSQLSSTGVVEATLESRGDAGDHRDYVALAWQMTAGIAPATIRHVPGCEEPALWLADFVCGAMWADLNGNTTYVSAMKLLDITTAIVTR